MTLFTWRGTPVRLHASFLWLAGAWIVMRLFDGGLLAAGTAAMMGVAVFGSVLLHEMGHAAMARAFEIRTRDITLYPFGGIASLEREPTKPLEEALVVRHQGCPIWVARDLTRLCVSDVGLVGAAHLGAQGQ